MTLGKNISGSDIAILSYLAAGLIAVVGVFIWRRQGGGWDAASFFLNVAFEGTGLYLLAFLLWPVATLVIVLCGQKKSQSPTSDKTTKKNA